MGRLNWTPEMRAEASARMLAGKADRALQRQSEAGEAAPIRSGKSVSARMNDRFKVVCRCALEETAIHLSGPLETQDELDALVQALGVMRSWLPAQKEGK